MIVLPSSKLLSHPKASQLLQAMFSGMGGGMGEAFNAAMDGDDEPMPQATPTPTPAPEKKPAPADPLSGLTNEQKAAVAEKEAGNEFYKKKEFETAMSHYDKAIELDPINITYYTNKAGNFSRVKLADCFSFFFFHHSFLF